MKFSTSSAIAIAFIAASTSATPVQKVQARAAAPSSAPSSAVSGGTVGSISADDIRNAVLAWRDDTAMVSNFLNVAADTVLSDDDLKTDAGLAFNSENDELTHKTVLDTQLCGQSGGCTQTLCSPDANGNEVCSSDLANANTVLVTQGTFQSVVDLLGDLKDNGNAGLTNDDLDKINNGHDGIGGRCTSVLPAIDTYFAQASATLISDFGDSSLEGVTAVRPAACG